MGFYLTEKAYAIRKALKRSSKGERKILFAFFFAVVTAFLWLSPAGFYADTFLQRSFYFFRGQRPAPEGVILVKIDDLTYKNLQVSPRHPFPRGVFADALQTIQDDSPKVVVLDLYAPSEQEDPEANEKLIAALRSGVSVIGSIGRTSSEPSDPSLAEAAAADTDFSYGSDEAFRKAAALELPMQILLAFDTAYHMNLRPDPALPGTERIPLLKALHHVGLARDSDPGARDLINYYGPAGAIPNVSLFELLREKGAVSPGYFKDKVVFVGFQSSLRERGHSDKEIFDVPVPGGGMYGVEIHASIASNLLDRSWIRRLALEYEFDLIVIFTFFLFLWLDASKILRSTFFMTAFIGLWYGASYLAFTRFNYFIPGAALLVFVGPIFLALSVAYVAVTLNRTIAEAEKALKIKLR